MENILDQINELPIIWRLAVFLGFAVVTHLIVRLLRFSVDSFLGHDKAQSYKKLKSVITLATSALIFSLYFFAVGLILREFGVSLTTYLASASVVGLAIGFGSQGIVQDVVTGLTFIFSDLVDVGDLVEISGQTGVVRAITMRFVELENAMGAAVFIPNRTINNVINYPKGYIRCIVDITLRGDETAKAAGESAALSVMRSTYEQFPGIFISAPSSQGRIKLKSEKEFLRLKFRIWPNRGQPIETAFNQELVAELKRSDPDYQNWMVVITYEVEQKILRQKAAWRTGSGGKPLVKS